MVKKNKQQLSVRKNPVAEKTFKRKEHNMSNKFWQHVLSLPTYDGIHALVCESEENMYQDNNPNKLEKLAQELGWENYYIVNIEAKDLIENLEVNNWQIFERYKSFQRGQKILKDFHGSLSDAVIAERRGDGL